MAPQVARQISDQPDFPSAPAQLQAGPETAIQLCSGSIDFEAGPSSAKAGHPKRSWIKE